MKQQQLGGKYHLILSGYFGLFVDIDNCKILSECVVGKLQLSSHFYIYIMIRSFKLEAIFKTSSVESRVIMLKSKISCCYESSNIHLHLIKLVCDQNVGS